MFKVGRVIRPQLVNLRLVADALSRKGDEIFDDDETFKEAVQVKVPNVVSIKRIEDDEFTKKLASLKKIVEEIQVIDNARELTGWDQETQMPENAEKGKIWQQEILERMHQEKLTSRYMAALLNYFEEKSNNDRLSDIERDLIRALRRDYEREKNTPPSLSQKLKELEVKGIAVIAKAREANDFNIAVPLLEEIVALKRQEAKCIGYKYSPYDALLSYWEPGVTTKDLDRCFAEIKKGLLPLVKKLKGYTPVLNDDFLTKTYSKKKLIQMCKEILELMGFDFKSGRLDLATDPFCMDLGVNDVRLTVELEETDISGVLCYVMHEGGHGLYMQGLADEIKGTYLADSSSFALDESQARLYENLIGHGKAFWIYYFQKLKEKFPNQLKDVDLDDFYKVINKIEISPDEWGCELLHPFSIIMTYEIEKDLIEGNIEVRDLPKVWNAKMREYFGSAPSKPYEKGGLLYESHWYVGYFAYFPTYTLGDIYASQIFEAIKKDIPDLELRIASGNMKLLREWLREKIHKHGDRRTTKEIIKEATGEDLTPRYFIKYLKNKYTNLFPEVFK